MSLPFILKLNASAAAIVDKDTGWAIGVGSPITIDSFELLEKARESETLRVWLTDALYDTGSTSTIIIEHAAADIAQGDALDFLDSCDVPDASGTYGVLKIDANGDLDASSKEIKNLAEGTTNDAAVNLGQLTAAINAGKIWLEVVLSCNQFIDGGAGVGGIARAGVFFLQSQPTANDTLTLAETTLTNETYTFKASEAVAFDVAIGVDVDTTLANLAQAINDDSSGWSAAVVDSLQSINDGTGAVSPGRVVIIWEKVPSETTDSRMFGTFASGVPTYVNFNGETDYLKSATSALPGADPGQLEFGFGRAHATLISNEAHKCRDTDEEFIWNSDTDTWKNQGASSLTASLGIQIVGNDIRPVYAANVVAIGTANAPGSSNELAHSDHVHAHGDLSGVAQTHHDTAQIEEDNALTNLGTSAGDTQAQINAAIDAALRSPEVAGKLLVFGSNARLAGTPVVLEGGPAVAGAAGVGPLPRAMDLRSLGFTADGTPGATRAYEYMLQYAADSSGPWTDVVAVAQANAGAGSLDKSDAYSAGTHTIPAGSIVRVEARRTAGSGNSTFGNVTVMAELVG